jgi:alpha-L-rhamnosidase
VVGGDLTFAEGRAESLYGTIRSRWEKDGDDLVLEVTIPPNSQATVHLPTADAHTITEGGKPLAEVAGVTPLRKEPGRAVLRVEAGKYRFATKWSEQEGI